MKLGRYELEQRLGAGATAEVWRARDPRGGCVVVKRIHPHLALNETLRHLFDREARVSMSLQHPNIVRVLEAYDADDELFLVMEDLRGAGLDAFLRAYLTRHRAPPPLGLTAHVVAGVARGLAYAHARKVVHRDISPSNVLLVEDASVKVLDFGIAKVVAESRTHSLTEVRGKAGYIAPETLEGRPIDHRVDIFATGVLLHEMLSGRRLFPGRSVVQMLSALKAGRIPSPADANPEVPPELVELCLRALERDPSRRLQEVGEIAAVLAPLAATRGWDPSLVTSG
jgi:serine/threonine-protein kinase